MPKLKIDINIANVQRDNVHGWHSKHGVTLHETVSPNYRGLGDVIQVSNYLDTKDYGIHGVTDADGNIAWSLGLGKALFYHTDSSGRKGKGVANSNFIGIEQVSRVMLDFKTRGAQAAAWLKMNKEIDATAKLIACLARAHGFPIVSNPGNTLLPGITTHYEITRYYDVPGGHVDCFPRKLGGYYPKGLVIARARLFYRMGYHF